MNTQAFAAKRTTLLTLLLACACGGEDGSETHATPPASSSFDGSGGQGAGAMGGSGGSGGTDDGAWPQSDAGGTSSDPETCNGVDDNGDGQIDEGCGCSAGDQQPCYSGPPETRQTGACSDGEQTCVPSAEFGSWGECVGSVVPIEEQCENGIDDDCDGQTDEDCDGIDRDVKECDVRSKLTTSYDLFFPETAGNCVWDSGQAGGEMRGHLFEQQSISIPTNWVVCEMKVTSPNSNMYYDDRMLVHFDERVLIGSTGIIDLLETDSLGLPLFDWSKLVTKRPEGTTTCIPGATACSMPDTQQNGPFTLEMDTATNQKLMTVAHQEQRYELNVVTTGDNDPSIDCAHSDMTLRVELSYYVK